MCQTMGNIRPKTGESFGNVCSGHHMSQSSLSSIVFLILENTCVGRQASRKLVQLRPKIVGSFKIFMINDFQVQLSPIGGPIIEIGSSLFGIEKANNV